MPTMTRAGYTPPKMDKPSPPPGKKGGKAKRKKKRGVNGAVLASIAVFLLAACIGAGTLYVFSVTQPYLHTFLPGTYLYDQTLAGLSYEQGKALLAQSVQEAIDSWTFEITWQDTSYLLTSGDVALHADADKTLEPLYLKGHEGGMLSCFIAMMQLKAAPMIASPVLAYTLDAADELLASVAADVECAPEAAGVSFTPGSSEPFAFTTETVGRSLDTSVLRDRIEQALLSLTSASVQAQPETIAPAMYSEDLRNATVLRARVRLESEADDAARHNLTLAAGKLNGAVVGAGETLSFNETVGARSVQSGYQEAEEPAYGPGVSGTGGGVCMLSSALYRAALEGMAQIVSRSAAVYPVPYSEMGQEAAVSDQGIDLVLANPTDYPLYVTARVYMSADEKTVVEVQLIGEMLDAQYRLETQALETTTVEEPIYVRDRDGKYAKYDDERVPVGEAMPGYSALVERVTLGADGGEIARETISEDEYAPLPPTVYVGIEER